MELVDRLITESELSLFSEAYRKIHGNNSKDITRKYTQFLGRAKQVYVESLLLRTLLDKDIPGPIKVWAFVGPGISGVTSNGIFCLFVQTRCLLKKPKRTVQSRSSLPPACVPLPRNRVVMTAYGQVPHGASLYAHALKDHLGARARRGV